jgi:hypothetical protein
VIKGLTYLSKIVSRFFYIREQLLKFLSMDEYHMALIDKNKYMDDPNA